MAFKTAKTYNDEKFGGLFRLQNDGDYADVIFMYQNSDDVLVATAHYIKSAEYSGYVHCTGKGCPACAKDIRVQTKLFIPLYNINTGEIQFFDRTMRFESQLNQDVISKFPNPSEYVFRITRHGVAGDVNTTYQIVVIGRNTHKSYSQILAEKQASFPEYYEHICREVSASELHSMLNTTSDAPDYSNMPSYQVTPRAVASYQPTAIPEANPVSAIPVPDVDVCTSAVDSTDVLDDDNVTF